MTSGTTVSTSSSGRLYWNWRGRSEAPALRRWNATVQAVAPHTSTPTIRAATADQVHSVRISAASGVTPTGQPKRRTSSTEHPEVVTATATAAAASPRTRRARPVRARGGVPSRRTAAAFLLARCTPLRPGAADGSGRCGERPGDPGPDVGAETIRASHYALSEGRAGCHGAATIRVVILRHPARRGGGGGPGTGGVSGRVCGLMGLITPGGEGAAACRRGAGEPRRACATADRTSPACGTTTTWCWASTGSRSSTSRTRTSR